MLGTRLFDKAEQIIFAARGAALSIEGHLKAVERLTEIGTILKERASSRNQAETNGKGVTSGSRELAVNHGAAGKLLAETLIDLQAHHSSPAISLLGNSRHPFVERLRAELQETGFTVAQVFWFISELVRAKKRLVDVLQSVKTESEWHTLVSYFTNHTEDPGQWGFPHAGNNEVDPVLQRFVTACRAAGFTPSYYFLFAAASLLAHGHREAAQA
ncbi:hypothetical protein KZ483_20955 [Paenibacillus sp. sptzw28]|uniref:hypothetical protein n=1 Tax=Paenibacillus sp. sptzw28 TaxID=715179 RepID=UPI001C6DE36B|nr:hypothetical protein [Paenibacillus sp. sptzw28]QYR20275.1 hypothetical protein KZ483_20955 [Paenibacillus sp. sptzw28]